MRSTQDCSERVCQGLACGLTVCFHRLGFSGAASSVSPTHPNMPASCCPPPAAACAAHRPRARLCVISLPPRSSHAQHGRSRCCCCELPHLSVLQPKCSSHTSPVFSLPFREVFRVRCFFFFCFFFFPPPKGYHLHGCSWSSFLDIHSSWQTSLVCDLFLCGLWAKSGFIFLKDYFNKRQRRIYDRDCGQQNLRNLPSGSFQKKPADLRSGILPRQSPPPLPLCALLNQRVLNL